MRRSLLLFPILAGLLGCSSLQPQLSPRTFADAKDAGSAHVAVLSVARWDDYIKDLQPSFVFTEEDALKRVSENSLQLKDEFVSSIATALKLAPPTSSVTSSKVTGGAKTSTETTGAGDVNKVPDAAAGTAALPTAAALPASGPSIEPALKYALATSLYQEVKLLSRYVHDAIGGRDYDPYVVRMQITLLPVARHEPYDAYSTITFFAEKPPTGGEATPIVVPLLVTDNVESAFHSSATDQIRQAALSLLFMVQGFGGSGQFSKFENQLKSVLGNDYNSLLTVSRLSDNTYRVRLGAMHQVDTPYEMIPRSHNITFLLLMPHEKDADRYSSGGEQVHLVSRTSLVDADTGVEVPRAKPGIDFERLRATLAYYGTNHKLDVAKLETEENLFHLIEFIERNDSKSFFKLVKDSAPGIARSSLLEQTLWLDLAADMVNGRYAATKFELPFLRTPVAFRPQTALLMDGGQVSLHDGRYLSADALSAVLHLYRCPEASPAPPPAAPARPKRARKVATHGDPAGSPDPAPPAEERPCVPTGLPEWPVAGELGASEIALVASKVEIQPGETDATFTFPPLSQLPRVADRMWIEVTSHKGFAAASVGARPAQPESSRFYRALVMPKVALPQDGKDFDASVPAEALLESEGKGTLTLVVANRAATPVHFAVEAADVTDLTAAEGVQLDAVRRTILDGTVRLSLSNLSPKRGVRIRTWKEKPPTKPGDAPARLFESTSVVDVRTAG